MALDRTDIDEYYDKLGTIQQFATAAAAEHDFREQLEYTQELQNAAWDLRRFGGSAEAFRWPVNEDPPASVRQLFEHLAEEASEPVAEPWRILRQARDMWTGAAHAQLMLEEQFSESEASSTSTLPGPFQIETTTAGPTSLHLRASSLAESQLGDVTEMDSTSFRAVEELESFFLSSMQRLEFYCNLWLAGKEVCPWMHELKDVRQRPGYWVCENCNNEFAESESGLHCTYCCWDVCKDCRQKHCNNLSDALKRLKSLIDAASENSSSLNQESSNQHLVFLVKELMQQNPGSKEKRHLTAILLLQAILEKPTYYMAVVLHELGMVKMKEEDLPTAELLLQESWKIQRAAPGGGPSYSLAETKHLLSWVKMQQGDLEKAKSLFEESLQIKRAASTFESGQSFHAIGYFRPRHVFQEATSVFQETPENSPAVQNQGAARAVELHELSRAKLLDNEFEAAESLFQQSLKEWRSVCPVSWSDCA